MDKKSVRLLFWPNESALHRVAHLPLAECPPHHLCGVAAHHAWGEGTFKDLNSVVMSIGSCAVPIGNNWAFLNIKKICCCSLGETIKSANSSIIGFFFYPDNSCGQDQNVLGFSVCPVVVTVICLACLERILQTLHKCPLVKRVSCHYTVP